MKRAVVLIVLLSVSTLLHAGEVKTRPENWAKPLHADSLKNFHQLDAKVYRSAQPGRKGCRSLQQLGIRNILNLRDYHSDNDEAKGLGIKLFRVKMEAGDIKIRRPHPDPLLARLRPDRVDQRHVPDRFSELVERGCHRRAEERRIRVPSYVRQHPEVHQGR